VRVLVTAGPTREHLDRVRYLSSASTGLMGIETAKAFAAAGHEAVLVLGPTHLVPPADARIKVRRIVSARDMLAACTEEWPRCDALVATAAVADYRPAESHEGKPEKADGPVSLALVKNPDVLAELAATKGKRPVIGFALQVEDAERRARAKLAKKNLDAVILDGPAALGADRADFTVILASGETRARPGATKAEIAREIVALVAR
jgi:phosphopantothenoylcysteine decarboxylase/phosphopantothenate--cysteine ligase